jgi:hypothetical protein
MNRKQRRAREAQIRKDGNDELAAQVAMFGKLPEECTACEIPFDKKNKEMATCRSQGRRGKSCPSLLPDLRRGKSCPSLLPDLLEYSPGSYQ